MVVDGDGKLLFGLFLADDVLVEEGLDLLRFRQMIRGGGRTGFRAVIFKDGVADSDTFVANIGTWIIARR
jgi:hypothetical protein